MQSHTFQTRRTVPWFSVGATDADHVVLHLHGLGERAEPIARTLADAVPPGACLVVPEALGRALPRPMAPHAIACWSTGEDAAIDLADNVAYLDGLRAHLDALHPRRRWTLSGFSQGGMTALRWLAASTHAWDRLVLWASAVPRALDPQRLAARLTDTEVVVALGDADPFATAEHVAQARKALDALCPGWRSVSFDGGHTLPVHLFGETVG